MAVAHKLFGMTDRYPTPEFRRTALAPGVKCVWRAMIHDSKEAHESLRLVNALLQEALTPLLGSISVELMQHANYSVDRAEDKQTPAAAARSLARAAGAASSE